MYFYVTFGRSQSSVHSNSPPPRSPQGRGGERRKRGPSSRKGEGRPVTAGPRLVDVDYINISLTMGTHNLHFEGLWPIFWGPKTFIFHGFGVQREGLWEKNWKHWYHFKITLLMYKVLATGVIKDPWEVAIFEYGVIACVDFAHMLDAVRHGWGGVGGGRNCMRWLCTHARCYAIAFAHMLDAMQLHLHSVTMLRHVKICQKACAVEARLIDASILEWSNMSTGTCAFQQPKLVEAARTVVQATVKKGKQDRKRSVFSRRVVVPNVKLQKLSSAPSFGRFFTHS